MQSLLHNITISMLGLEQALWEQTPEKEQKLYARAMVYYIVIFILAIVSSITLLFLITSNLFVSIIAGIILAGIIGTIIRFSLVIMRRSIFDSEQTKPEVAEISDQNSTKIDDSKITANAVSGNIAVATDLQKSTEIKSKRFQFLDSAKQKIKNVFSNSLVKKFFNNNSMIPGLAGLIRITIMSVLGLLILFPLVALVHFDKVKSLNEIKREEYINKFIKDQESIFLNESALTLKSIKNIQNSIEENKGTDQDDVFLKYKTIELKGLKQKLNDLTGKHDEEFSLDVEAYRNDVSKRYFIVHTFNEIMKYPLFVFIMFLVAWLLIAPHLILNRLKSKDEYVYSILSTEFYRSIIDTEYNSTLEFTNTYLKDRFSYNNEKFQKDLLWENPPYRTIKNKRHNKRKVISKSEFIKSLVKI